MTRQIPASIHELTSLRAIAALTVVIFHMFQQPDPSGPVANILSDGHLGVDLFFVLSGFVLTHVYLDLWNRNAFDARDFFVKRLARVYPLHLVMILLFIAAYQVSALMGISSGTEGQKWQDLPWHLLLLHAWGTTDSHAWNFPSWSVSAEAFAYLCFPLVLAFTARRNPIPLMLFALCAFVLASLLLRGQGIFLTKLMYDYGIARIAFEFLLGVAAYRIFLVHRLPDGLVKPAIALATLSIILASATRANESLIVVLLTALIFLIAHLSLREKPGLLRSPALIYLGEISYSTYMCHILVLMMGKVVFPDESGWIWAISVLTGVYILSAILYHAVERPGRRLLRAWLLKRSADPGIRS